MGSRPDLTKENSPLKILFIYSQFSAPLLTPKRAFTTLLSYFQKKKKTTKMSPEKTPPPNPLPWTTRLVISLMSTFSAALLRRDGTVNRRILSFFDHKSPPSTSSSVASSDITADPTKNLWFRLYAPATSPLIDDNRLPVMVFFHGGGFCINGADTRIYDAICRLFVEKINVIVISVNYRLTPEYKFPSQYDDGLDVLKFLDQNVILPRNADVTKIFLIGDSAGANLAHQVAVRSSRVSFGAVRIIGLISIQPFFGGEERTESEKRLGESVMFSVGQADWYWRALLGEGTSRDHYVVNVSGPNAEDISGLEYPDTLVFVGGADPLQDWQRRYYEWLRNSGKRATLIEYPNMFHGFLNFRELSESQQLVQQVKDFIDETIYKYT